MIVQCDQCNAKFRLDDSKVKEGGVKVRCSKCKNIFMVQTEQPAEDSDYDSFLSGLMPPSSGAAAESGESASVDVTSAAPAFSEAAVEKGGEASPEEPDISKGASGQEDFDLSEFAFNQESFSASPSSSPEQESVEKDESGSVFGELDLGGANLTDTSQDLSGQRTDTVIPQEFEFKDEPATPSLPEFELDVEGLGMFGEPGEPATPEAGSLPETNSAFTLPAPEEFSFEPEPVEQKSPPVEDNFFANDPPVISLKTDDALSPPAKADEKSDSGQTVPFDFSDFDFGDGAVKENAETVQSQPSNWGAETQGVPSYSQISAPPLPDMQSFEEESPPLSISSRRRDGSGLPVAVIAISVLLVLALAGGGFYVFREGPSAFNKLGLGFMSKLFGSANKEEGGILLRNTVGTFLNNKEVGEVFVISGEAVNNYGKPRASIQVKATMYGPKGAVLLQKIAYCGNNLSREQLTSLPAAKLETAMNNQFGDSLSNLAIQPGKTIPFVIALSNVPKEVVEFGVEIVGSTVASQ